MKVCKGIFFLWGPLHMLRTSLIGIFPIAISPEVTMVHTTLDNEPPEDRCECERTTEIPFLDTSLKIENGKIDIDLYKKKTDRNQYLLPSSCHPKSTTKSIPYSLSLRIVRICSKDENKDMRLSELKELLLARNYPESLIDRGIEMAKKIPRKVALMKVKKKASENRSIFIAKYDPRIPALEPIVAKHWRAMKSQDKYLKDCFTQPPLIGFRRQANIRDLLIRSKIPPPPKPYPERTRNGMTNCGKMCPACPYIKYGKEVSINDKEKWNINRRMTCETYNIIYMLECQKDKCRQRYIGTTGRQLKLRLAEHRGYISNQVISKATGAHWNLPGHSLADLRVTILEQTKYKNEEYRKEREKHFIRKFDTFNSGINREW